MEKCGSLMERCGSLMEAGEAMAARDWSMLDMGLKDHAARQLRSHPPSLSFKAASILPPSRILQAGVKSPFSQDCGGELPSLTLHGLF